MKPTDTTTTSSAYYTAVTAPTSIKFTVLFLLSLIITFLFSFSPYFPYATTTTFSFSTHPSPPPPPPPPPIAQRLGLVDENGAMRENFHVSPIDPVAIQNEIEVLNKSENERFNNKRNDKVVSYEKFQVCEESKREFIPCLDNVEEIKRLNLSRSVERFERHCPVKALDCLVPAPKRYQKPIPWPQSRDEVWFSNVPHTRLVEEKGGQNWIAIKDDKFIFPGGGTQFIHGADQYLNQISMMVHDMSFGFNIRTALDIGCGVASFGAFLLERSTITLSIAPKDVHENQIQFALERGVPAMIAVFSTRRLMYPSQAFDMIHCSRCRIDWWSNDGILLLEVNRMLRAGGYFVWAAQPVYKHEDKVQEQWKEMLDLTSRICWKLVKKERYIAIWQKPWNNSCYLNRNPGIQPPLCDSSDDPDIVWYAKLKNCITRLPESGYGANVTTWPIRLHLPPDRVQSTKMDAYLSRKDIFKAETKYWYDIIDGYIKVFRWKEMNFRNVMDMRAGFGGFAAALDDHNLDCWVMNVVPVNGFNTLPVVYDRGLIGVLHDWCESFDTYPRTYDLLNAAGLFSVEQKRKKCNISIIMVEMDRILRPDGLVYIRDTLAAINELQAIATAMGWVPSVHDSFEGPHTNWKILICQKRMR